MNTIKPIQPNLSPTVRGMSGVAKYRVTKAGATVTMMDGRKVKLSSRQLPDPSRLSAFTIADAVSSL